MRTQGVARKRERDNEDRRERRNRRSTPYTRCGTQHSCYSLLPSQPLPCVLGASTVSPSDPRSLLRLSGLRLEESRGTRLTVDGRSREKERERDKQVARDKGRNGGDGVRNHRQHQGCRRQGGRRCCLRRLRILSLVSSHNSRLPSHHKRNHHQHQGRRCVCVCVCVSRSFSLALSRGHSATLVRLAFRVSGVAGGGRCCLTWKQESANKQKSARAQQLFSP